MEIMGELLQRLFCNYKYVCVQPMVVFSATPYEWLLNLNFQKKKMVVNFNPYLK